MLAFSRIPGNAFSFWIRRTLRWSRGRPALQHEPKSDLFRYLSAPDGSAESAAEAREAELRKRYRLEPLARESTQARYRKNLYLIDLLEKAAEGLPALSNSKVTAMDIGSQDWHYVFGLERWLRHGTASGTPGAPVGPLKAVPAGGHGGALPSGEADEADEAGGSGGSGAFPDRKVSLRGVEVDGYGIYPDLRSRKDYAEAFCAQTGNPEVTYEVGDALDAAGGGLDLITIFYPFVTRHHLLLWGLPLRFFRPAQLLAKAASLLRPGGRLLVFTHTLKEHELFTELGKGEGRLRLAKEGRALSDLVDFHEEVIDRRYSVWERRS